MSWWYPLSVPTFGDVEIEAATKVLKSGDTTMGEEVAQFEMEFAAHVEADHAVMVNSGSSADLLIAMGLRGVGGQVLIPAVTWPTHLWSWVVAGFDVKLVDVDPYTLNATTRAYGEALEDQTTILSLVHLMGLPCEMDSIVELARAQNLIITEDCCEALGSTYANRPVGGFGKSAAWSFFFSHQMTTMEGGMVTTNDASFADQLRGMRSHGWTRHISTDRYTFADVGFNLRPTEVQAAIGRVQLRRLRGLNARRATAHSLFMGLVDQVVVSAPQVLPAASVSWFGLPLLVGDRDGLAAHLEAHGVETRPILGGNLARQPMQDHGAFQISDGYPGADYITDHGLFLGLHPDSTSYDIERVAGLVNSYTRIAA